MAQGLACEKRTCTSGDSRPTALSTTGFGALPGFTDAAPITSARLWPQNTSQRGQVPSALWSRMQFKGLPWYQILSNLQLSLEPILMLCSLHQSRDLQSWQVVDANKKGSFSNLYRAAYGESHRSDTCKLQLIALGSLPQDVTCFMAESTRRHQ